MANFGIALGMMEAQNKEQERRRSMQEAMQGALMEAVIKQKVQQQDPMYQFNQLKMAQALQEMQRQAQFQRMGDIGYGGARPTAQEALPYVPQQLQQRFMQRPTSPPGFMRQQIRRPFEQAGLTLVPSPEGWESAQKKMVGEYDIPTLNRATTLRKEFNADKVYQDYQTIDRSFTAIEQAYKLAIKPDTESKIASDQMLGVLFQKILDPQSVVRESEYARTPEGAALMNRINAILPQMQKGGLRLSNADRLALVEGSRKLLISAQQRLDQHIDRYTQLAKDYQVDPKLILGNIRKFNLQTNIPTKSYPSNIKVQYNALRANGVSIEEAKRRLGL